MRKPPEQGGAKTKPRSAYAGGSQASEEPPALGNIQHPTSNIQHPMGARSTPKRKGYVARALEGPTPDEERQKRRFDLEERMLAHAARIVSLYDSLPAGSGARQIGNQLIRSGTSPYLHHGEVEAAESLDDFVHKLKICLKELRETRRALRLLRRTAKFSDAAEVDSLINETEQLILIFFQSIRTVRQRRESTSRVQEDAPAESHWMLDVGCWMLDVSPSALEVESPDADPNPEATR